MEMERVTVSDRDRRTHQRGGEDELDDIDEAGVEVAQAVGAVLIAVGCGGRGSMTIAVGDELCGEEGSEEADGVEVEGDLEAQLEVGHGGDDERLCCCDDRSCLEEGEVVAVVVR